MPTTTVESQGDVLRRLLDDTIRAWDPVLQSWSEAMPSWPTPQPAEDRPRVRDGRGCGHEHQHAHRSCSRGGCYCCVEDADLVVVTRLGESRIVPLVIHNEWRRERVVELEVGEFSPSCGEDALVRVAATTRPKGPITLAPCGRIEVGILLRTALPGRVAGQALDAQATDEAAEASGAKGEDEAGTAYMAKGVKATELAHREDALPDVGCCTAMFADVRVLGCRRPLRLAVVVLPLHCDAFEVQCHCGCC